MHFMNRIILFSSSQIKSLVTKSGSGDVNVSSVDSGIFKSSSGDITIKSKTLAPNLKVSTSSGDIKVQLKSGSSFNLEASSSKVYSQYLRG